jgi:NTP pyrophosphatase (non-canonical NTP hydrolase)
MKDLQLSNPYIFAMVQAENKRQVAKWGIQNRTPFEWLAYTTEELGELSEAISEWSYRGKLGENVVKEAIQTATLCLKIAEMFMPIEGGR